MLLTSNKLVRIMPSRGKKQITLELDEQTMAEFGAAAKIFGTRSKSSLLHQLVIGKIYEAQKIVSEAKFNEMVQQQISETEKISKRKILERVKSKADSNVLPFKPNEVQDHTASSLNFQVDDSNIQNIGTDPPDGQPDPFLDDYIEKHLKGKEEIDEDTE